ncbi:MAG: hypothetical protein K0S11_1117 [Gammaproteobacteria bacterium]|jgi:hypothetical protein|nr:hypothetical protein [Gammaproteobacteria bacterium]
MKRVNGLTKNKKPAWHKGIIQQPTRRGYLLTCYSVDSLQRSLWRSGFPSLIYLKNLKATQYYLGTTTANTLQTLVKPILNLFYGNPQSFSKTMNLFTPSLYRQTSVVLAKNTRQVLLNVQADYRRRHFCTINQYDAAINALQTDRSVLLQMSRHTRFAEWHVKRLAYLADTTTRLVSTHAIERQFVQRQSTAFYARITRYLRLQQQHLAQIARIEFSSLTQPLSINYNTRFAISVLNRVFNTFSVDKWQHHLRQYNLTHYSPQIVRPVAISPARLRTGFNVYPSHLSVSHAIVSNPRVLQQAGATVSRVNLVVKHNKNLQYTQLQQKLEQISVKMAEPVTPAVNKSDTERVVTAMQQPLQPFTKELPQLADAVYKLIVKRVAIEKERKGLR